MKKKNIQISLETDFNSKNINNYLKKSLNNNFNVKVASNDFENINTNLSQAVKNKDFIFIITHLEKTFIQYSIFHKNGEINISKLNKEINIFSSKIINLAKNNKQIYFFQWPLDINDDYMGNLNFKKGNKSWLINYINLKITENLSSQANLHLIDVNFLLLKNTLPLSIYDEKTKFLTNNSYSLDMINFLSKHINFLINDHYNSKKIKLIILDLDNTLWGGEAGEKKENELEIGPNSIKGAIFQQFQQRLKLLKKYGVILAICSKNYEKNALRVFKKNKNMILKIKDFASIKINWNDKNINIAGILKELNLRSENTLFIDDSKYEQGIVKKNIKNIQIFDFPQNLLELNYKFNRLKNLNKNFISNTDLKRHQLYKTESKRESSKKSFQNPNEWIKSLNIKIKIERIRDFSRAEEMFSRTNQFNTSHKKYSILELKKINKDKSYKIFQVSLHDKFGNYGIISLVILKITNKEVVIRDLLQSCRVFKRYVEDVLFFFLKKKIIKSKDCYILINRNKKNVYVQHLLQESKNFKKINKLKFKLLSTIENNTLKKLNIVLIIA